MSKKQVRKFRNLVLAKQQLQTLLQEPENMTSFVDLFVSQGKEHNYNFSKENLLTEIRRIIKSDKIEAEKNVSTNSLKRWVPIRLIWKKRKVYVDFCYIGKNRFKEPFFYDNISDALKHPFNSYLRRKIKMNDLVN